MTAPDWLKIDLLQIEKWCYQRNLPKFLVPMQKCFSIWSIIFWIITTLNLKMLFFTKISGFLHKMPRNRFSELYKLNSSDSFCEGTLTSGKIILKKMLLRYIFDFQMIKFEKIFAKKQVFGTIWQKIVSQSCVNYTQIIAFAKTQLLQKKLFWNKLPLKYIIDMQITKLLDLTIIFYNEFPNNFIYWLSTIIIFAFNNIQFEKENI